MLYMVLIVIAVITGGYFAFRYFLFLYAFKQITKEIGDIQHDLTQNQILHLPIPDRHLGKLLSSFNTALEDIQKERQNTQKEKKNLKGKLKI